MAKKAEQPRAGGGAWLSRLQVASLLGVSEADVEAMHSSKLHPWQEKDRRWRYRPEEVARILRREADDGQAEQGKLAARAFAMFRGGQNMAEVVIATEQPAATVKRLFAEYLEMAGGLWLPPAAVSAVRSQLGDAAVGDGQALATAVESEPARRYAKGHADGKAEAEDYGEVVDFQTGERKRVLQPR